MYISSISSISSGMPRLEEIRCINCGELNYLREDRPSGESEKCGVCGKSLHLKASESTTFVDMTNFTERTFFGIDWTEETELINGEWVKRKE